MINQFQTNNFNELQEWFQELEKSKSINANLIEPLLSKNSSLIQSRPYIIASYGSDNKYSGLNFFSNWIDMHVNV